MVRTRSSTASRISLAGLLVAVGVAAAQTTTLPNLFTPAPGNAFPAGANPRTVVAGDFNGDQIGDIAAVNPYTRQVTLLFGTLTGAPVKQATVTLPTWKLPSAAAAGYFVTASPNLCLAVADLEGNDVSIFVGNGDGTFMPATTVKVGESPAAIAAADFDLDGNLDLAVANAGDNTVTVLFGDGKGNFSPTHTSVVTVGSRPVSIAVGNFGGIPGIAVANQIGGTVTVISAVPNRMGGVNGMGVTMTARGSFPVLPGAMNPPYPYPSAVAVADLNGDGFPDIVTANDGTGNLSVLLGDGLGGFVPAAGSPIAVGLNPMAVATADFNGDGNPDLAVANYSSGTITVLMGTGTGTFTAAAGSPFASGASPASLAVGDFNGSSRPSLAVANQGDNTVTVLLNAATPPLAVVSGGSLTGPVSPGSVISIFGSGLASATITPPSFPLPFTLGGAYVAITYSNGTQDLLPLSFVSPTQINAVIPANPVIPATGPNPALGFVNPALGLATVTVVAPAKTVTGSVEIALYAPTLITASQNGKGVAQATYTNALFETAYTYQCSSTSPAVCLPLPLDLSGGGILTLNATGLNNFTDEVMVTVGSETASVSPVPTATPGIYQLAVPLVPDPKSRGVVPVVLSMPTAQGILISNTVTVLIQ